jgi:hypothetical protein
MHEPSHQSRHIPAELEVRNAPQCFHSACRRDRIPSGCLGHDRTRDE